MNVNATYSRRHFFVDWNVLTDLVECLLDTPNYIRKKYYWVLLIVLHFFYDVQTKIYGTLKIISCIIYRAAHHMYPSFQNDAEGFLYLFPAQPTTNL